MMIVSPLGHDHGRSSVVADDGGLASVMIASDQRLDGTVLQNNAEPQMPDAPGNVGRHDRAAERAFLGQP